MATQSETPEPQAKGDGEQRIREKAYQLWQLDGSPQGQEDHYWRLARELIDAETK